MCVCDGGDTNVYQYWYVSISSQNMLLLICCRLVLSGTPKFCVDLLASSPGHSQILSRSDGEKSGEGLVPILRHGPEMVDLVST